MLPVYARATGDVAVDDGELLVARRAGPSAPSRTLGVCPGKRRPVQPWLQADRYFSQQATVARALHRCSRVDGDGEERRGVAAVSGGARLGLCCVRWNCGGQDSWLPFHKQAIESRKAVLAVGALRSCIPSCAIHPFEVRIR